MKLKNLIVSAVISVALTLSPARANAQYAYYPDPMCPGGWCGYASGSYWGWGWLWVQQCYWSYYEYPGGGGAYYDSCGGSTRW